MCNCNARHFTGKRSGLSPGASLYTIDSMRQGQQSPFFERNENSLVALNGGILGHDLAISPDLRHEIRDLWGQQRLGGVLASAERPGNYKVVSEDAHPDGHQNSPADGRISETPLIIIEPDGSNEDSNEDSDGDIFHHYPVLHENQNAVHDSLASEQNVRRLELALRRALQEQR